METKTFTVLTENGDFERWKTTKEKIDVGEEVIRQLTIDAVLKVKSVFEIKGISKTIDLALTRGNSCYVITLSLLPLKAPYKMEGGVLTPRFSEGGEPVIPLMWVPPDDMKLVMLVMLKGTAIVDQWLFAFDSERRAYRLPVGNLYEDGRLCNGEMVKLHPTAMACVAAELEQFEKGQWNSDLDIRTELTKKLFRFNPLNDKFEQLPPLEPWQQLCDKVAPAILKYIV